jgi:leucine dehydrogenase
MKGRGMKNNSLRAIMKKVRFGAIYRDSKNNTIKTTHKELKPLKKLLLSMPDYDHHDCIALEYNELQDTIFSAFIHRTYRGQAQGGLRFAPYGSVQDFLFDGVRLSTGMSRKNALAGLWWGGGKGIIVEPKHKIVDREILFNDYGKFISRLRGSYVTAEDVGTSTTDMKNILKESRFVTCLPKENGGSGNPSEMTAKGVVSAIDQIIEKPYTELKVAIQGAGNVSKFVVKELLKRKVSEITISDINTQRLDEVREIFSKFNSNKNAVMVTIVNADIMSRDVDVLVPCAMGGVLNDSTIPKIRAKYVVGAANNQLEKAINDVDLKMRGIVYIPDFVINRMGIVNCCNEQFGILQDDPLKDSHYDPKNPTSIPSVVRKVLERSKSAMFEGTNEIANKIADQHLMVPNPIYGSSRVGSIINQVCEDIRKNK